MEDAKLYITKYMGGSTFNAIEDGNLLLLVGLHTVYQAVVGMKVFHHGDWVEKCNRGKTACHIIFNAMMISAVFEAINNFIHLQTLDMYISWCNRIFIWLIIFDETLDSLLWEYFVPKFKWRNLGLFINATTNLALGLFLRKLLLVSMETYNWAS